jgi:hypothetical protein
MIDLKYARKSSLSNLTDRCIVLPLSKCLPQLLPVKFVEHILRAYKRRGKELELSPFLHRVLINLLIKSLLLLTDYLQLIVDVVEILHVLSVALLLVS